ncbi:MAG: ribbon-helix-helix domain-containing protein [Alphaproteobacteria bacterium]|nr:ribbon-helix-helix domain-containing protein [Alphaproteobacteria bacterium]
MKKFSVLIAHRHATSISLEEEFYQALVDISKERNITLSALITEIDEQRTAPNLSSAIRIYILKTLKQKLK